MPQVNSQEQRLRFLIWFLRKRVHEILSGLSQAKGPENDDITDILRNILETVTLAEYLDAPIDEKIGELSELRHFVQTLSGIDIHGNEVFRRGPDVD
ncbi:MAG TPA: hypothetical protein VN944_01855 [Nitrospiria bacterium]|nr:hypothetical protein [Nitrospiria bacterium]